MAKASYDELADWYESEFLDASVDHRLGIDRGLSDLLGEGSGECLEIGCGTGVLATRVRQLGWSPIGVDISAGMLRHAVGRLPMVRADAEQLPFANESMSAVIAVMVHTDMPAYPSVVHEAARVLRPHGTFVHIGVHPCFCGGFADRSDPAAVVIWPGYLQNIWTKESWLSCPVALPTRPSRTGDLVTLEYVHFSVVLDTTRRLAAVTAVNIDGSGLVDVGRGDDWHLDPRIDSVVRAGPALYGGNDLDRGHLVRRRDPVWGPPAIAERANFDTFAYPNAAPQAANFNQSLQLWLGLEPLPRDLQAELVKAAERGQVGASEGNVKHPASDAPPATPSTAKSLVSSWPVPPQARHEHPPQGPTSRGTAKSP